MRLLLATTVLLSLAFAAASCGSDKTEYVVTVSFNETVTQADMDAVSEELRAYDDDLDFLVQESFPPTGVAYIKTDVKDFCTEVEALLEGRSYISSVTCAERAEIPVDGGDTPVSYP